MAKMRVGQKHVKQHWFSHTNLTSTDAFASGIWMGRLGHGGQASGCDTERLGPARGTDGRAERNRGGRPNRPGNAPGKKT